MSTQKTIRQWTSLGFSVMLLATVVAPSAALGQAQSVQLESILQVWQARQERVRTANLAWKEQVTQPRASISAHMPHVERDPPLHLAENEVIPPEDQTHDFALRLDLDGDKARFSYKGMEWAGDTPGHYRLNKYESVFDGTEVKELEYRGSKEEGVKPQGAIRRGSRLRDAQLYRLRPILLAYRALKPELQPFDLKDVSVRSEKRTINGHDCIELEKRFPRINGSLRLWVDPNRDYVVVRHTVEEKGEVRVKIDIDYYQDVLAGWVPTGWTIASHGPKGLMIDSTRASMTTAKFNENIDSSSFILDFPDGSTVIDEKNHQIKVLGAKPNPRWGGWILVIILVLAAGTLVWRRISTRRATD